MNACTTLEAASATPVLALEMMFTSFQGWQLIKMSHKMHLKMKKDCGWGRDKDRMDG